WRRPQGRRARGPQEPGRRRPQGRRVQGPRAPGRRRHQGGRPRDPVPPALSSAGRSALVDLGARDGAVGSGGADGGGVESGGAGGDTRAGGPGTRCRPAAVVPGDQPWLPWRHLTVPSTVASPMDASSKVIWPSSAMMPFVEEDFSGSPWLSSFTIANSPGVTLI